MAETSFSWQLYLRSSAAAHTSRMNCDKMAAARLDSLQTGTAIGFRASREY